jgi:hypothetical protein
VLDLDGTLIPYDFMLDYSKIIINVPIDTKRKIILLLGKMLEFVVRRAYEVLLWILIRALNMSKSSKYFTLSPYKSYYGMLLTLTCRPSKYYVNKALLDGIWNRKVVWKLTLNLCRTENNICILVTANSFDPIIKKIQSLINIKSVFKSYMFSRGFLTFVYVIDKNTIAKMLCRIAEEVLVITDSLEDLKAFSKATHKLLVTDQGLRKLC